MSEIMKIVSSQYKHLPTNDDGIVEERVISSLSALQNEPVSFQVLYRAPKEIRCFPAGVQFESDLPIACYRVDSVAVPCVANPYHERGFASDRPGVFPDILFPRPVAPSLEKLTTAWGSEWYFEQGAEHLLNATDECFQSVWVTVNEDREILPPGEHCITIKLMSYDSGRIIAEQTLSLSIANATLPDCDVYYTNWLHVDSLCDTFGVSPYSDAFYEIFDEHIANMTTHGQNMLLLPAFTPSLDTKPGYERMNVQLVDVEREGDGWKFSFEKLRKFVRHALAGGITSFEHTHLFSQWGACGAPNIYLADGARIFSLATDAGGQEYIGFIRAYLTAFLAFAEEEGIGDRVIFHLSDEPYLEHLEAYRRASEAVRDLLEGKIVADAMSEPIYYTEGLLNQPIVDVSKAKAFEETCPSFWLYYTGGNYERNCANRMITNTPARTRVLGVQMYRYKALGFLHWAYNYYYDRLSAGFFSPLSTVGGYKQYPGLSYLAYPMPYGRGGVHVLPSIREKLMAEAMNDLMALKLLESLIGRDETLAICESRLGEITTETIPEGEDLRELREEINRRIASAIG